MKNFKFIENELPELAKLANQAEDYIYTDPESSVMKLRCFIELYVGFIYEELNLPSYGASNLFERLDNAAFSKVVESNIVAKLHAIRMKGNKAAHDGGVSINDALWLNKEAFLLAIWISKTFHNVPNEQLPNYHAPKSPESVQDSLLKDKENLEKQLELQTVELESAKAELIAAERVQKEAQIRIDSLKQESDLEKLSATKNAGQRAIESYDFEPEKTQRRMSMEDVFTEYRLTDGQAELVKELNSFLNHSEDNVFLLKGYAGTGKTFITKGLTEYFRAIGRNYVLAAPTGKASKVIATKTKSKAYTIHKTIYSFKDIKEYKEENLDGSETYKFYADLNVNELSVDTVYIVDEASMLSDIYNENEFFKCGTGHLLKDFLKFVNLDHNDHRKKIIFIGDNAQLPPVGMKFSPALDSRYLDNEYGLNTIEYELKEVVRQKADSGVMHNAISMRKSLEENVFNQLDFNLDYEDVEHVDYDSVIESYLDSCDKRINAESIVIAHSNVDVAAYNKRIREEFFPSMSRICSGDKVMAVTNSDAHGFFISNGDFGLVRKALGSTESRKIKLKRRMPETNRVEEFEVLLEFRDLVVAFRDLEGNVHNFETKIVENLLYSDAPSLSSDENKALYVDFCIRNNNLKPGSLEFRETLRADPYFNALRLKFGYAITCHKAQGSEWNNVFVKCKTHQNQLCADYFRWLYTAITRTSNKLYLMDEPHIKLGSNPMRVRNPGIVQNEKIVPAIAECKEPTKPINNIFDVANNVDDENFGIDPTNTFLLNLLSEVKKRVINIDTKLVDVLHNNYQEVYVFSRGEETARISISYKGNRKISSIILPKSSELGSELLGMIRELKGRVISDLSDSNKLVEIEFDEPFLEEYYQRILPVANSLNINIVDVEQLQYCQRYHVERDGESAVINISYKKTKRISSYDPIKHLCTSNILLNDFISILDGL